MHKGYDKNNNNNIGIYFKKILNSLNKKKYYIEKIL